MSRCTALGLVLVLTACASAPLTGPPSLRLGRDLCAECGMMISDGRFAAGAVMEDDAGRREHAVFDDPGCLLDALRSLPAGRHAEHLFVRDYATGEWVLLADAWVVTGSGARTPMGWGIIAFGDRAAAEGAAKGAGRGRVARAGELLRAPVSSAGRPGSGR